MEAGDIRRRGDAPSPPPGNRHHAIADLAFRQHGVVARRQLLAMGLSRTVIEGRRSAGYLHQLHLGVYAVGHGRLTQCGRWMAAVLACGDEAVLSHRSAAALWGIAPIPRAPVDVTVPPTAEADVRGFASTEPAPSGPRTVPDATRFH